MDKLKPCPCCGNPYLYSGHMSAVSHGVECFLEFGGCGLSIAVELPAMNPELLTMDELEAQCMDEAVASWNRREGQDNG